MLNIKKACDEIPEFSRAIKTLAINVRKLRRERGWDTYKLADWSDVAPSTINNVECCRTNASLYTVAKLAKTFDKEVWELYKLLDS